MNGVTLLSLALLLAGSSPAAQDSDRDGLSDFHERHKYRTDPERADSDGDGVPDGDWLERREYAYTVRAVVQVMKPVTSEYLNDDYQDARVLDEGPEHVELEVVLYPFNTVGRAIEGARDWHVPSDELAPWLAPGPTSDWTPRLRAEILAALEKDGIDLGAMDDRAAVKHVSRWLMERSEFRDGFTSFYTAFDEEGRPFVPEALRLVTRREADLDLERCWEREISARGMFANAVHGSCTSSSIYLSGCLKAVGVPTRTVLCIPLIDASDAREHELAARLVHPEIRSIVLEAAQGGENTWTSHTFNEVHVGGRWRRLNYSKLGQDILDPGGLGLMIHVATFRDWADARMPDTIGARQALSRSDDLFGGPNPYSTISLRDAFGPHCEMRRPGDEEEEERSFTVEDLLWSDDPELPDDVRRAFEKKRRFGLVALVGDVPSMDSLRGFMARADLAVALEAEEAATVEVVFDPGFWWLKDGTAYVAVPFGREELEDFLVGVEYRARAENGVEGFAWELEVGVRR